MNSTTKQQLLKPLVAILVLSSLGGNVAAQSQTSCQSDYSAYCQNLRNAEAVHERQRREQAARQQQEYLRQLDHANGNTQSSGPTFGGSVERREIRGGYQWTLD